MEEDEAGGRAGVGSEGERADSIYLMSRTRKPFRYTQTKNR